MSLAAGGSAAACGIETDCRVGERTYRIALPSTYDGRTPVGAILFMHGYRGRADGIVQNPELRAAADALGVALIAPQSADDDWDLPNAPRTQGETGAGELAFFDALVADATTRFRIDPKRLMATGFSAGGMMTWTLACRRGDAFVGFAPLAGTFWAPLPESCPSGPVNLVHVHGTSDTVVPLEGRRIADTAQGDVSEAIELMASTGFGQVTETVTYNDRTCERRVAAATDGEGGPPAAEPPILELCLHPGGHSFDVADIVRAWRLFTNGG